MSLRVLGIEIERRTDILAFAAFLMALGNVVYQAALAFRGPDIHLFPPEQLVILGEQYPSGKRYVRFAAKMSYVNDGSVGYNAAVVGESLHFQLGDTQYEQRWQTFESFQRSPDDPLKLESLKTEDAHPFTLAAGSTVGHETYFAPRKRAFVLEDERAQSYLEWPAFLEQLEKLPEVRFELRAEVHGMAPEHVGCTIRVDDELRDKLEQRGWYAPSCY